MESGGACAYHRAMNHLLSPGARGTPAPIGHHIRSWRQRRRLSQQGLAHEAEVSTRHLSFIETGRAEPSREMVLRLAARLDIPLRERNTLLVAAGYAPMYRERSLDDPELATARAAVDLVLKGHEPYPALALDRHYNVVAANRAVAMFLQGVPDDLLAPPMNVLRISLDPRGVAPRIENLVQWRKHLFERLRQQIAATADPTLVDLLAELKAYPVPEGASQAAVHGEHLGVVMPFRMRTPAGVLSFISTVTIFGTAHDVTLQELMIESFFPADALTAQVLRDALA
jgi:transcriptional regulator with XRE-family HTH domain